DPVVLQDVAGEQLPDELEDGEGLAGARRHQQQHALLALREAIQRLENSHLLVWSNLLASDLILVPGSLEDRPPRLPDYVATKEVEDVPGARRLVEGLILAGLVVGEEVLPSVT